MAPNADVMMPGDGQPTHFTPEKSPAVTTTEHVQDRSDHPVQPVIAIPKPENDYSYTFDNKDGSSILDLDPSTSYRVAEHILWAPRKIRVASIGAGASGLMFCYKKEKEFGDSIDLVVYDRYAEVGGVWHANKYPGCRCDVPSAGYQFSFAPKADWPRYYSPAKEIQKYYADFAADHDYVMKYIKLRHEVTKAAWEEEKGVWHLSITETLESGETRELEDDVDFLIGNIGVLNTWKWPDIPDRESFKGQMTHSASYDTSIDCTSKRVAVIGSGASSIQIVPAVQKVAAHLTSFYRTPQWITTGLSVDGYTDPEGRNFDYSSEQIQRFRDDPEFYLKFRKAIENKINSSFRGNLQDHPFQKLGQQMIEQKMAVALKHDPVLTKRMIPEFSLGCRRLGPGEGFLETMLENNVTLASGAIEAFTEKGIRTDDGVEHEFDIIICATGFDVSFRPYFQIVGRGGRQLADDWKDEPAAYLAMAANGYPNFMLGSLGPNCPAGHGSFVTVLEAAQNYICRMIRKIQTENIKSLEIKADAVVEYNEHVHEWLKRTVWASGCRSWYNQGKPHGKVTAQYPGSLVHWRKLLETPRYEDYDVKYRGNNRFRFMGNGFTQVEVDGGDLSWYLNPEEVAKPLFDH